MSLVPPFTQETAYKKVKAAQKLWNTCDPTKVCMAYTEDSIWRNREHFFQGREKIIEFLTAKWQRETKYKLRKDLFCFNDNRIAVCFYYEYWHVAEQSWKRCYGLEDWIFEADGRMSKRQMSGNEITITEGERWYKDGATDEDVDQLIIADNLLHLA